MRDLLDVSKVMDAFKIKEDKTKLLSFNLKLSRLKKHPVKDFMNVVTSSEEPTSFVLRDEWVISQVCSLMEVKPKFYTTSPSELLEESFNTRVLMCDDKFESSIAYFSEDNNEKSLRSIQPASFSYLSDYRVLDSVISYLGGIDHIKGVDVLSGSSMSDSSSIYMVVSDKSILVSNKEYFIGTLVKSSELGAHKIQASPILYSVETSNFIPYLNNKGNFIINLPYQDTKAGPVRQLLEEKLLSFNSLLQDNIDQLESKFEEEVIGDQVIEIFNSWEDNRNVPKKVVSNAMNVVLNEDEEDESGINVIDTSSFGGLCNLLLSSSSEESIVNIIKSSFFVSNQCFFKEFLNETE